MHSRNHDQFLHIEFCYWNYYRRLWALCSSSIQLPNIGRYLLFQGVLSVQPSMISEQITRKFEERVKELTHKYVVPVQQPEHSIDQSVNQNQYSEQSSEQILISIASSNQYLTKQSVSHEKISPPFQNQRDILKPGSSASKEKKQSSLNESQKLVLQEKMRKLLNKQKQPYILDDDQGSQGNLSSQNSPSKKEQNPTRRSLRNKCNRNFASLKQKPKNQKSKPKQNSQIIDMSSIKRQGKSFCSVHTKVANTSLKNDGPSQTFQESQSNQPKRQINRKNKKTRSSYKSKRPTNRNRQLQVVQPRQSQQIEAKEQELNQTQKKQVQGIIQKFMEDLTGIITPVIINQLKKKEKLLQDDNNKQTASQPKQKFRSDHQQTQQSQRKQFSNFFIKNPYPEKLLHRQSISSSSHQQGNSQNSQKLPKYDKKTIKVVKQMEQKLRKIEREHDLSQQQMRKKLVAEAVIFLRQNKIDKATEQMIIKQLIEQNKMKYCSQKTSGYKWQ